ncbi:hypothetical protein HD554DRAFT_2038339 [Boletus coccyginus]|nr:hypothetical protein HD554DRAFT_2038339 [Boletus coccyginus]
MLNKISRLLYTGLRGLFFCKCIPETNDLPSKDSIAPKTQRGPHLSVFVEDPSEVRWDSPTPTPPLSEKFSRSVSNGSVGGHQHTVVEVWTRIASGNVMEPYKIKLAIQLDMPPSMKPHMQNHREMLVQQTQPATSLSEVDDTKLTGSSSVLPRSEETTDDQSLPGRPKVVVRADAAEMNVQSAVVPSETDDRESAVEQDALGSQLGLEQEQEDVARGSSQGQIIDEDVNHPVSMVDDQSHCTVPPDTESQGNIVQAQAPLDAASDEVAGYPLPVQERLPRKKVGPEVEAGGDQPPPVFKEKLTIEAVVEGEETVGDTQTFRDKSPEAEVDLEPPRITVQERLPRKKEVKQEEIVGSAQPPRISKDRLPRKKKVKEDEESVESAQPSRISKDRLPRKKV